MIRTFSAAVLAAGLALPAHAGQAGTPARAPAAGVTLKPAAGKEGTVVVITYPQPLADYPNALRAQITDPGVHGYHFVRGGGLYLAYDGRRGLTYTAAAKAAGDPAKKNAYTLTIPAGVCGVIVESEQNTVSASGGGVVQGSSTNVVGQKVTHNPQKTPPAKMLEIALEGQAGAPAKFALDCERYTAEVDVSAYPATNPACPLPAKVPVTAVITVKGPPQLAVGVAVRKPANVSAALIPVAFVTVMFDTTFGTLAPDPAKVQTDTSGIAHATLSASTPGNAAVRGVAGGLGDGRADVAFGPCPTERPGQQTASIGSAPPGPSSAMQQCTAAVQQRHHDIVSGMQGKPAHEIAAALVESDAKNPSVAECTKSRGGGGGGDTAPVMQNNGTGNPDLDGATDAANKSADKQPATAAANNGDPNKPKPDPNPKKKLLLGGIAAGGVGAVLVAHGGGGGGGAAAPPSSTPPAVKDWTGTYTGVMTNRPANTTCAGVTPSYDETLITSWQGGSRYKLDLFDNPSFTRSIVVDLDPQNGFAATGSAPFNATETYTGSFTETNGVKTLTLTEQSDFGTCRTVNGGTLSKR